MSRYTDRATMALSAVAAVCDRRSALPSRAGFERRFNLCRSVV